MLLILAAATAVTAAPAGDADAFNNMPNLYQAPAHCRSQRYQVVDRFGRPVLLPLGSLPQPSLQLAVDRRIDGCRVVTVARGSPPPAADQPNPPARRYRLEPLRPK
jgi:hypothetical protein